MMVEVICWLPTRVIRLPHPGGGGGEGGSQPRHWGQSSASVSVDWLQGKPPPLVARRPGLVGQGYQARGECLLGTTNNGT